MRKVEEAAIEALAKKFSATWSTGEVPVDAYIKIKGKRVSVNVIVAPPSSRRKSVAEPRLRFDRVAIGLVRRLQVALSRSVPDGKTVVVTVTAPIWQDSKTRAVLEDKIQALLARPARRQYKDTVHGNRIQVQVMKGGAKRTAKLASFVHNPYPTPTLLFEVTRDLLACIGPAKGRLAGDRWLVIANPDGAAPLATYRHVCTALGAKRVFKRILVVGEDGVAAL